MNRAVVSGALLVVLVGCAATKVTPSSDQAALGPGPLLAPGAMGAELLWRQRVSARWPDGEQSFDAALQLADDELVLVGFGAMGRPGFIVKHTPNGVTFENRTGRPVPFDAAHIVGDVQKAFYPWLPAAPAGFTGTRDTRFETLSVRETYEQGVLVERRFEREDAPGRGAVVVRYRDWKPGERAPGEVQIDNAWFGYQLQIVTVEQQPTGPRSAATDR